MACARVCRGGSSRLAVSVFNPPVARSQNCEKSADAEERAPEVGRARSVLESGAEVEERGVEGKEKPWGFEWVFEAERGYGDRDFGD